MLVIDASIAVKVVLNEDGSELARELWGRWTGEGERLVGPPNFRPEAVSAIRKAVYQRSLSAEDGERVLQVFQGLPVAIEEPPLLYQLALTLSARLNRSNVYDACYLALAEIEGCEFWTADGRLVRAARAIAPGIRLLSEAAL